MMKDGSRLTTTIVYVNCLCRLHKDICHCWENRTEAAADEKWMPRKLRNHDDVQRQRRGEVSDTFAITNGVKHG